MHENIFHNIHIIDVYSYIDVYSVHALFSCLQSHVHHDIESLFFFLRYFEIFSFKYTTFVVTLSANVIHTISQFLNRVNFHSSYNWNITIVDSIDRWKFAFVSSARSLQETHVYPRSWCCTRIFAQRVKICLAGKIFPLQNLRETARCETVSGVPRKRKADLSSE